MKTELLKEGISQLGLSCSDHQIELLQRYSELLLKWNKVYNLTSIRNPDEVLTHHILDSLSIIPVYRSLHPDPITVMDVGSGVVTNKISPLATRNSNTASDIPAPVSIIITSAIASNCARFLVM